MAGWLPRFTTFTYEVGLDDEFEGREFMLHWGGWHVSFGFIYRRAR